MPLPRLAAALAALLLAVPALAQDESAPAPPRLVVAISIDQLSADLFAQYRQHFTGGFARLMRGAVFPSGYQAHAATETCPGHSTILTGAHPARSGIIANNWFDMGLAREDSRLYCAEDPTVAGSSSGAYTVSANNLLVPTLGDLMKAADPASRVVAVAGKDRAAVMMGGHHADYELWWRGSGFTTFDGAPRPAVLDTVNQLIAEEIARPRAPNDVPDICRAYQRRISLPEDRSVGTYTFERDATDARGFLASPDGDTATLGLAEGLIDEMALGRGEATDLIAIGLSATDYIGHAYGTEGVEMCIQLMALDHELGDFFDSLDAQGISYVAVLTADHGGLDLPERQNAQGITDAARVLPGFESIDAELAEAMDLPQPVLRADGPLGDFYIDRSVPEDRRAEAIDRAMAAVRAQPQVYRVFGRDEIMAQPLPTAPPESWTVLDRVRASFYPDRSGDFVVVLNPRVTPIPQPRPGIVATHGSVWDYDRRVPILFWWPDAAPMEQPLGVMTVDIMPTLASLIGLDIGATQIDGHCLDVMASVEESNCP